MLSAVVERLLKAMRDVRPQTVRQFFALASQHMCWELNDLARRLDERAPAAELHDSDVAASVDASGPEVSATAQRILQAIESLPDEPREAFNLVRIQGMTQPEAAAILGVAPKTVKRRLDRARLLLVDQVSDLDPAKVERPYNGLPAE
jgi:RNA polymerase sigma-70 factor (ECF subfamily)